jgi:hypothetical protein
MGHSQSLPFTVTAEAENKSVAIKLVLADNCEYGHVIEMQASHDFGGVVRLNETSVNKRDKMHHHRAYLLKLPGHSTHVNVEVKLRASELVTSALLNPEVLDKNFVTRIKVSDK